MKFEFDSNVIADEDLSLLELSREMNNLFLEMNAIVLRMNRCNLDALVVVRNIEKNMMNTSYNFVSSFSKSFLKGRVQRSIKNVDLIIDFSADQK